MSNYANLDPMARKAARNEAEAERKSRLTEAAQLMARLALILEKSRPFDQFLYRLRRKRCMKIVWTRRGRNEDTIISDMLKWLRNKAQRLDAKATNPQGD